MDEAPTQTILEAIKTTPIIIKPGDKIIFQFDRPLDQELAKEIRAIIQKGLGEDTPILVIDSSADIYTLRNERTNTQ